jgi:predicted transglutaminase-like cysteine proteinase
MQALLHMAKVAAEGAISAPVRLTALRLTKPLPPKDWIGELCVINAFVRDRIRYSRDVYRVETLQTPAATLELGQGDCDDKATLVAAMLMAVGFPVRFALLNRTGQIVHVWTQAHVRGRWIDCETTENVPCGQLPPLPPGDRIELFGIAPHSLKR